MANKSHKTAKIVGVAVVILVVAVVVAVLVGVHFGGMGGNGTDNTPPRPQVNEVKLQVDDLTMLKILEVLAGHPLPAAQIQPYFTALNMEVYANDELNAIQLREWFEAQYALDGWTSVLKRTQYAADWVAYHEIWTRGADARAITIANGAGVTLYLHHPTAYLMSHGVATTYWQFWLLIQ